MLRTSKGSIENSICDHLPFSDRLGLGNFLDVKKAFALRGWKQDLLERATVDLFDWKWRLAPLDFGDAFHCLIL